MHHIQRHILKLLIENHDQRYNQLRPPSVEPNQFVYHLKQLIKLGLVAKCDSGYELTPKGRAYADKIEDSYEVPWDTQPRNVLLLALQHTDNGWLLIRRNKQPTINKIGFISANMRLGEAVVTTARQHMQERHGITADFEYKHSGSITLQQNGSLESYVVFHLLYAEVSHDIDITDPELGWYQPADLANAAVLPSTLPLIKSINDSTQLHYFIELDLKLH